MRSVELQGTVRSKEELTGWNSSECVVVEEGKKGGVEHEDAAEAINED